MKQLTFIIFMKIMTPLAGDTKVKFGGNHYVGRYYAKL